MSHNVYLSLSNYPNALIAYPVLSQFTIDSFPKKPLNLEKNILFKNNVIAEIINHYTTCFYANNIYGENSFLKKSDIHRKILNLIYYPIHLKM